MKKEKLQFSIELDTDGPIGKDYYETRSVGKGKGSYSCNHCNKSIGIGQPSDVHKFYPEFQGYRTHPKCSDDWLASIGARTYDSIKKKLHPPTSKVEKKIEKELTKLFEENQFLIHEAHKSMDSSKIEELYEEVGDIFNGEESIGDVETTIVTSLGEKIKLEIYYGLVDITIE